ncbi:MAG: hypothetical protein AB1938_27925 [Myxococcota bacterium]
MGWKPELAPGIDLRTLPLSPLHGFVLSRIDGHSDVDVLTKVTGLPAAQVDALLKELVASGAVRPPPQQPGAETSPGSDGTRTAEKEAAPAEGSPGAAAGSRSEAQPSTAPTTGSSAEHRHPEAAPHTAPRTSASGGLPHPDPAMHPEAPPHEAAADPAPTSAAPHGDAPATPTPAAGDLTPPDGDDTSPSPEAAEAEGAEAPESGTHRQLYEGELHALTAEERGTRAQNAVEPYLSALCFDPLPSVIGALLDNPHFGLEQARLVARHHRNPNGLEALASRAVFAADGQVRRLLLHNPMLPGSLYRRLWTTRRLLEQHQVVISREVPEQTRRTAREVLRARFSTGPSEEKAELIVKTEGRCLGALVGLPIDSKTTSLLCARTYASVQFIQNLARWAAAPPQLVAHLQRQDAVKRNAMLRTLLERHPNAPRGHV